jgi:hypothetical protein
VESAISTHIRGRHPCTSKQIIAAKLGPLNACEQIIAAKLSHKVGARLAPLFIEQACSQQLTAANAKTPAQMLNKPMYKPATANNKLAR